VLPRTLEPEVMDTSQEALDYDAMDHSEVNRRFLADLLTAGLPEGEILDLGTGTAQIPIELCTQRDDVQVMAVDLAESMLDVAIANIDIAGLRHLIQVDRVDAKDLPYEDGRFACVMSNSIVHHIPQPAAVLAEAVRVTSPGGLVFFRDLSRPDDDGELAKLVGTYAGDGNEHQRRMFADSLRAALRVEEMQALLDQLGLPGEGVSMTSDRHWTWQYRKG